MTDTTPETAPVGAPPGRTLIHLLCLICYPDAKPGDVCLCGYADGTGPRDGEPDCMVCLDMAPIHHAAHAERGEV